MMGRKKYIYLSIISLVLGACVYVFFKEKSYLHLAMVRLLGVPFGLHTDCVFVNHHLCDFLWAFSLACGLLFILGETKKVKLLCGGITVGYGAVWELLQFTHIASGTGDLWDVLSYFLASLLAIFIFNKKEI